MNEFNQPPPLSGLDIPVTLTLFRDEWAKTKQEVVTTLRGLAPTLLETRGHNKASLPWLKLAAFGDHRSDKGSLRNNANVLAIHGVEADYDAATITLERARQIVAQANLAALIYTSPSHTPQTPKWRILCPTSCAMPPADRANLLARLNGLFVGALAPESFTLSQSYYYGAVGQGEHHQVIALDGRPIDLASDLASGAIGRATPPRQEAPEPTPYRPSEHDNADGTSYGLGALQRACEAIRNAPDGSKHHTLNREAYSIGGLVTGGDLVEGVARAALADALASIRHRCEDYKAAERTLADAFKAGMDKPRQPPPPLPPMPPQRTPFGIGEANGVTYDAETGEILEAPPAPASTARQTAKVAGSVLWIDAGEWDEATIPKRPWLAAGYLMRGAVSALSGQGSGGKSSLTVCWTISLALGDEVGDFKPVGPLKVVNYNVEDDQLEQRRRYSAALKAANKTPADIGDRIVRCGPETIGTLFERDPVTGRITPTPAMDRLEALCQETGADVLICDPLAELHNAEENDNTAMRAVVAAFRSLAKRLNIAVLLLHHDRKGNNAPGDMDRLRGASAITGAVRVLLTLTTMSAEEAERFGIPPEERRRHFRIDGAKSNYAVAQEAEWWRLSGYALANGEEVAACRPWAPPSAFDGLTMADCVAALETLQRGTKAGHAWAAAKQAGDDWGGRVLTNRHGLTDAQADAILGAWLKAGVLSIEPQDGPRRGHPRKAFTVSDDKISEMRRHKSGDVAPW